VRIPPASLFLLALGTGGFRGNFESGDLKGWTPEVPAREAARVVTSPVRAGRYALRIEWRADWPKVNNGLRSEITRENAGGAAHHPDRWFTFSLLLPEDWEIDPVSQDVVVQWHQTPDRELGEGWRSPPLALCILGDRFHFEALWDARQVTPQSGPQGKVVLDAGPIERGRWVDWAVHVHWSYGEDGLLEVWRDGTRAVTRRGPLGFNDRRETFFKTGIYKWVSTENGTSAVTRRVLYVDEVRWKKPKGLSP
jgi:hypothetical protein